MRLPGRPPALSVASPLPLFLGRALQGQAIPHFRADFAWTLGLSVGQSALSRSSSAQGHFRSSGPVGCPRNSVTSPYRRRNSIAALPTIQFSRFIMCDFLQPHGQQHARLPCPTPTPRTCSNSSVECVMPAKHLILCRPILPPSVVPRNRVFSNGSVICIRWPKYWRFSFSIGPYTEYSELSSFRMHWLDLPAVQGTLKSLLQHHSSNASILWCLAFVVV